MKGIIGDPIEKVEQGECPNPHFTLRISRFTFYVLRIADDTLRSGVDLTQSRRYVTRK